MCVFVSDGINSASRPSIPIACLLPGYGSRHVCVSVKSHLTSGVSVRPKNAVTNSAGDEGRKICGVFFKTHAFLRLSAPSLGWPHIRLASFPADNTHTHCASSARFVIDSPCCKLSLRSV